MRRGEANRERRARPEPRGNAGEKWRRGEELNRPMKGLLTFCLVAWLPRLLGDSHRCELLLGSEDARTPDGVVRLFVRQIKEPGCGSRALEVCPSTV